MGKEQLVVHNLRHLKIVVTSATIDLERFSALKPHLLVSDFERYWSQGVLNAEYGPKDDEAQWIVAMVHRIVEPYHVTDESTGLTLWRWREDGDIFAVAPVVRGPHRFYTANVKELVEMFELRPSELGFPFTYVRSCPRLFTRVSTYFAPSPAPERSW